MLKMEADGSRWKLKIKNNYCRLRINEQSLAYVWVLLGKHCFQRVF